LIFLLEKKNTLTYKIHDFHNMYIKDINWKTKW